MSDTDICEVVQRARTGEKMEEKEFDMQLFKVVENLLKESDLRYTPKTPVNTSDSIADQLFEMGVKLFSELGTFCMDTKRVIRFSENEIRSAIDRGGSAFTLGSGKDKVIVKPLRIEGNEMPVVCGGIQTQHYSDERTMFKIMKACAEDKCVDGIWGGVVNKIDGGYDVVSGTPTEIYAYRRQIEIMRDAINAAGRPEMFIMNNAPLSTATIGMRDEKRGLRSTDPADTTGISELKISFDDLNRSAHAVAAGQKIYSYIGSVIGGFSGSIEGAAVVGVAGALQLMMVNQADMLNPGANHFRVKSKCSRDQIWVSSIAHQACCRNIDIPLEATIGDHPAAGPGTKQYFYEGAAGFIASTVSGCHAFGGTRKFITGSKLNYGSPLESRWYGEVLKGATGLTRDKANEIIVHLLEKYEKELENAPPGYVFEELYDVERMLPRREYQLLYDDTKNELAKLGITFREF